VKVVCRTKKYRNGTAKKKGDTDEIVHQCVCIVSTRMCVVFSYVLKDILLTFLSPKQDLKTTHTHTERERETFTHSANDDDDDVTRVK